MVRSLAWAVTKPKGSVDAWGEGICPPPEDWKPFESSMEFMHAAAVAGLDEWAQWPGAELTAILFRLL